MKIEKTRAKMENLRSNLHTIQSYDMRKMHRLPSVQPMVRSYLTRHHSSSRRELSPGIQDSNNFPDTKVLHGLDTIRTKAMFARFKELHLVPS